MLSPLAAALRSQPAQKKRSPAPVSTPTRRSGSRRSLSNAANSAWLVATSTAFAGGRSRVISRVCPDTSVRTGAWPSARAAGTSAPVWSKQRPSDDVPLYLAGAIPDSLHSRVPPPPFQRQLAHQAHAAEDLHGRVGQTAEHLG